MRVCRFRFDDLVLTGFYGDNVVIPLDQAAEMYSRETGDELLLASTEDLLDLLPPSGPSYLMASKLNEWIEEPRRDRQGGADDPLRRGPASRSAAGSA